jgi:hypothetical protein
VQVKVNCCSTSQRQPLAQQMLQLMKQAQVLTRAPRLLWRKAQQTPQQEQEVL